MSVKELIFNNSKWFNKEDHLIVPKTITIKRGAFVSPWADECNPNAHGESVLNTKTVNCIGVYSDDADYTAYAFDGGMFIKTSDSPNGDALNKWVKADKNVIPNWGVTPY